jgi:transcriptional regulator GlxA family with amidase domain
MNAPILGRVSVFTNQPIIRVMILVVDGVSLTTVSTALEPFQQVNTMLGEDRFHIQLVSLESTDPMTSAGVPIPCHLTSTDVLAKLNLQNRPDLLILCCGQMTPPINQASAGKFARKIARQNVPIFALGAACFIAAKTAMIKGGKCATHWKMTSSLAEQFPAIEVQNVLYVLDECISSCAGEFATFDMILALIERIFGSRMSGEIRHHFIAAGQRSGDSPQRLSGDAFVCEDERFQKALSIMVDNIEVPVAISEIASRLGYSIRQIERIFGRNGFESPHRYYINLRLNRARQLIEQTNMSFTEIALASGFDSSSSFSNRYKLKFGAPPKEHRNRTNVSGH